MGGPRTSDCQISVGVWVDRVAVERGEDSGSRELGDKVIIERS